MPKVEVMEYITEGVTFAEDKPQATVSCKCGNQIGEIGWEWVRCSCGRSYCLADDKKRVILHERTLVPKVQDMRVNVKVRAE